MDLEPGTTFDRYVVEALLGAGAMARVYRVRHRELGARYAMKVLKIDKPAIRERLRREGRVQASFRHRNVVGVTDTVEIDGDPAIVMEYVDGPDLDAFILEHHPLDFDTIASIGGGIIKGVRAAHSTGNLHRDLKPANVMMKREDGEWIPKVADFGLAKALETEGESDGVGATRTGMYMGSPSYSSPEQAVDSKYVDFRTDVFSLGCILYELVTGERAFEGSSVIDTLALIAKGIYPPISNYRADVPASMEMAITGALIANRDQRLPSCNVLLDVWQGRREFRAQDPRATATYSDAFGMPNVSSPRLRSRPADGSPDPRLTYDGMLDAAGPSDDEEEPTVHIGASAESHDAEDDPTVMARPTDLDPADATVIRPPSAAAHDPEGLAPTKLLAYDPDTLGRPGPPLGPERLPAGGSTVGLVALGGAAIGGALVIVLALLVGVAVGLIFLA